MNATALFESSGALLPHMMVLLTGLAVLLIDLFVPAHKRYMNEVVGMVGLGAALLLVLWNTGEPRPIFLGMAVADNLGAFFQSMFLVIAGLTILLSASYVRREQLQAGEYYALVLFATVGFMFAATAGDLVMVFLAIETLSIATYILAGFLRDAPRSQEAAFKYFMLGAFSSAFFLYGIATVYGALGSTNLATLAQAIADGRTSPLLLLGIALVIVGLGFKVTVVPFHMWAPDVYDGAPTAVTAFMAAGPKAAAFAAFLRVFFQGFSGPAVAQEWVPVFAILAALTMILGNIVALAQHSIKRMLAYSSIAHAGYAFVALVAHNALGATSLLYYLLAYALMSLGAFTVLMVMTRHEDQGYAFDDYAGLGQTRPLLAALMALFMLALAGFPPTAGFAGKFYIFSAAVQAGHHVLALIGVLTSVISVVYYIRVIMLMYMQEPRPGVQMAPVPLTSLAVLGIAAIGVVYMGVFPGGIMHLAERSVQMLF